MRLPAQIWVEVFGFVVWVLLEGESIKIKLNKVGIEMFYRIEHTYRKHMFSRVGDQDSTENRFFGLTGYLNQAGF